MSSRAIKANRRNLVKTNCRSAKRTSHNTNANKKRAETQPVYTNRPIIVAIGVTSNERRDTFRKVEVRRVQRIYSIKPKAAATPAATIPAPYSPPIANIVAAAPVEELEEADVVAAVESLPEVGEGVELAEELLETGAVKLAGSR